MRDERARLADIIEAIDRIAKYSGRGRQAFEQDELIQNWIISNLQNLGEAASRLSGEFQLAHPETPWTKIIGMRNVLVHGYFTIDPELVWQAVEQLHGLRQQIQAILNKQ
jgi:uncharacterized protein with HEPN domain